MKKQMNERHLSGCLGKHRFVPSFVKHKPEYCGLAELAESDFIVLEKRSMRLCSVKQFSRHECDKRERQSGKSLVL